MVSVSNLNILSWLIYLPMIPSKISSNFLLSISIIFNQPFSKSPINIFLLTLSGFKFNINLKDLISISFWGYFSGITHELTMKVKIGIMKVLMISTLPSIERFRFDHDKNKLLMFSIFFFPIKFFKFYVIMTKINPQVCLSNWYFLLLLTTRHSLFNNACYSSSSKSKLLWSYHVKPSLIIQGIIRYINDMLQHIYHIIFHTYFSIRFCILLNNTFEYIFLHIHM